MAIESFDGENRWLSNFWPAPVELECVEYPSVEHAYQAAKTEDPLEREQFLTGTAARAKRAGRGVTLRPGWNDMKYEVMRDLVEQKFSSGELKEKLIGTGDTDIVEGNTWGDTYWGICRGKGENNLGRIIMEVRENLTRKKKGASVKLVIFGSRKFNDAKLLKSVVEATTAFKEGRITDVISGKAPGADSRGEDWARANDINVIDRPAAWKVMTPGCRVGYRNGEPYNKDAGHIRNAVMADEGDAGLGFWDFKSPGTRTMIALCLERKMPLIVVNYLTGEIFGSRNGEELKPVHLF